MVFLNVSTLFYRSGVFRFGYFLKYVREGEGERFVCVPRVCILMNVLLTPKMLSTFFLHTNSILK